MASKKRKSKPSINVPVPSCVRCRQFSQFSQHSSSSGEATTRLQGPKAIATSITSPDTPLVRADEVYTQLIARGKHESWQREAALPIDIRAPSQPQAKSGTMKSSANEAAPPFRPARSADCAVVLLHTKTLSNRELTIHADKRAATTKETVFVHMPGCLEAI